MKRLILFLSICVLGTAGLAPLAAAGDLTAEQIIEKSTGNRTVKNSIQTMSMKIFDSRGNVRVRKITSKIKENEAGLARSYVRFDEPADVEGVQFLTIQNEGAEDDQWLYMPAGGMLNRISGSSRRGSFMGSDFSFEDLSIGGDPDDGTHKLLGEATITVDGAKYAVYKIETVPDPELKSAYKRFISYIGKDDFMPRQIEFYDAKKGELIKRMSLFDVEKSGELLVPRSTKMENLRRGTKTEVYVEEYRLNVDPSELPDEMFTPDFLQSEG